LYKQKRIQQMYISLFM